MWAYLLMNKVNIFELEDAIKNPLKNILYFEDKGYKRPHFYIIIPTRDKETFIMLTMLTSQIKKRNEFYKNDEVALSCLHFVKDEELSFLTKDTLIDCNSIHLKTKEDILKSKKLQIKKVDIKANFLKELVKKINTSKKHKPSIKKKIDLSSISDYKE